jgi:hypothetical protein
MTIRLFLAATAFGLLLAWNLGPAKAQSDEEPSASQQLEDNVDVNSNAAVNNATSDENASYLSGGGFDSEGNTSAGTNDGSDLQPHPFEATPNE